MDRKRRDGDYPYVAFRYHPKPATLDPFLTAMTRAVTRMPRLKHFGCYFPDSAANLTYCASGYDAGNSCHHRVGSAAGMKIGRWLVSFGNLVNCRDGHLQLLNWKLPEELLEVLKKSDQLLYLSGECAHVFGGWYPVEHLTLEWLEGKV